VRWKCERVACWRWWHVATVLGVVVVAAACSSASPVADTTTSVAPATSSTMGAVTTTTSRFHFPPDQQPAVDTYLAFDRAFHTADRQADLDFTELSQYSSGEAYQANMLTLKDSHEGHGEQARPGPRNLAQVLVYGYDDRDGKVHVDVCAVDDDVIFHRDDGAVVNDKVSTQRIRALIDRVDGRLKVTELTTTKKWPGVELETCLHD
jgi:hypothetical protein